MDITESYGLNGDMGKKSNFLLPHGFNFPCGLHNMFYQQHLMPLTFQLHQTPAVEWQQRQKKTPQAVTV